MSEFDPNNPSIARVYDYLLGGKNNFAADREMAEKLLALVPEVADALRDNKAFLARAVTWVASQGIGQFLDLGCGMPTPPTTHETARAVLPDARVAYVDNDPVVLSHLSALLGKDPGVCSFPGDVSDTAGIIALAGGCVDFAAPACVMMGSLLHFFPVEEAVRLVRDYTAPLVPGSYLVLSVARPLGDAANKAARSYRASGTQLHPYTEEQIASLFELGGLELVEPGVTMARRWRPGWTDLPAGPPRGGEIVAGVARITG